jgi:protein SDA1
MGIRSGEIKERRFGEEEVGEIEGLELLEKWKEEERKRKRAEKGLSEELDIDEDEEDWGAWEVESNSSNDSGGWINVESDAEIEISDSEGEKPVTKKVKISLDEAKSPADEENENTDINLENISNLATKKILTPADLAKLQELRLEAEVNKLAGNKSQRRRELEARHADDPLTAEQIEGFSKKFGANEEGVEGSY